MQTGVGAILNVARPEPGSTLVIFGAGGVGLAAVLGATLTAVARIVVVDVEPSRLKLAAELSATHTINAATNEPSDVIRDITGGVGANYTFETSGLLTVLHQAITSLAAAGTCVVIGAPPLGSTLPIDSNPAHFIPQLIQLHREGRLPFDRLITTFPFEQINKAADAMKAGTAIKPVLVMPS